MALAEGEPRTPSSSRPGLGKFSPGEIVAEPAEQGARLLGAVPRGAKMGGGEACHALPGASSERSSLLQDTGRPSLPTLFPEGALLSRHQLLPIRGRGRTFPRAPVTRDFCHFAADPPIPGGGRVLVPLFPARGPITPLALPEHSSMATATSPLHLSIARSRIAPAAEERRNEGGNAEQSGRSPRSFRGPGGRRCLQEALPRDCALHNRGLARHGGVRQFRPNQSRPKPRVPPLPA